MNTIEKFFFTPELAIEVEVPDFENKSNYYYDPISTLNKFDEVSVLLKSKETNTVVVIDIIQVIICSLYHYLKKALRNELLLPTSIYPGLLGASYNRDHYKNYSQDETLPSTFTVDYQQFWLWSSSDCIQSWMYNRDNKIYLEIGKVYEPGSHDLDIRDGKAFQEFMANYKPILFVEVSHERAQEWLQKCEKIIRDIDSEYELTQD